MANNASMKWRSSIDIC